MNLRNFETQMRVAKGYMRSFVTHNAIKFKIQRVVSDHALTAHICCCFGNFAIFTIQIVFFTYIVAHVTVLPTIFCDVVTNNTFVAIVFHMEYSALKWHILSGLKTKKIISSEKSMDYTIKIQFVQKNTV